MRSDQKSGAAAVSTAGPWPGGTSSGTAGNLLTERTPAAPTSCSGAPTEGSTMTNQITLTLDEKQLEEVRRAMLRSATIDLEAAAEQVDGSQSPRRGRAASS